ncbi:hypothetical protein DY000_02007794 [Brassica cretica]|uniref:Uncharacterized protein n=1 Tax=Brassica cretica TaxID=69181 RepID=A0ABQ7BZL2_BRACR|nr:hypothetical protein DY000_02007794 [Brassica cretica]
MKVDEATEGRRLRKRKEKIPKNLKREANEKEMDGFTKRVLRIPVEKSFDEGPRWPCKSYGWENSTSIQGGHSRYSSVGQWTRLLFLQQRSIPDNIPAVPDEHPRADTTEIGSHQSCQPVGQTSIDKDALTLFDGAPSPSIDRRYECRRLAYDIYGASKFRWE